MANTIQLQPPPDGTHDNIEEAIGLTNHIAMEEGYALVRRRSSKDKKVRLRRVTLMRSPPYTQVQRAPATIQLLLIPQRCQTILIVGIDSDAIASASGNRHLASIPQCPSNNSMMSNEVAIGGQHVYLFQAPDRVRQPGRRLCGCDSVVLVAHADKIERPMVGVGAGWRPRACTRTV
jgi:hypothetical protein